ncbi:hypothetical protein ACFWP3_04740 [Streptomyces sp. NPDC058525]|uniref:hypothetical protein n=1 Tax=Streptomyces sp. NPDC058525 TaxID=3346538 RepID=UPI00365B44AB
MTMVLAGCGAGSEGATPAGEATGSPGGTAKQRADLEAHQKKVRAAADEVNAALADAGVTAQAMVTRTSAVVMGTHPEATVRASFTKGFDNLAQRRGWQVEPAGADASLLRAEKQDGCRVIGTHDFTDRRPQTKPGEVTVTVSVTCND